MILVLFGNPAMGCSPHTAEKKAQPVKLRPKVSGADYLRRRKIISRKAPTPASAKADGSGTTIPAAFTPPNPAIVEPLRTVSLK